MTNWTADDGTLIYYETYGAAGGKETLLLLPGLLGAISSQWRQFIEPLASDYRLILIDWRGHGRSENREPNLRPERLLQDLVGLLDHLRVDVAHIAGYSLGGYIGLMLALNQPRRVPSLLMHATKFYWTQDAVAKMRQQLDPDIMATKVPTYADQLVREHGSRWRMLVRQAGDLVALMADKGITEGMVARLQIPVIVSVGDRDELVPLTEAHHLSRVLPMGQMLVLPGVRHPYPSLQMIPLLPMMQHFHRSQDKRR